MRSTRFGAGSGRRSPASIWRRSARRAAVTSGVTTVVAAVVVGVVAPPAFAVGTTVAAATGGNAIAASTAGPSGAFTGLTGPVVTESTTSTNGGVGTGRFELRVPTGFEFRTTSSVTVTLSTSGNANKRPQISASTSCTTANKTQSSLTVTPTASAVTFYVCNVSTDDSVVTFSGIAVRPTASTPLASGNIYLDNTGVTPVTITGVTGGPSGTNFGTLVEAPTATTGLTVSAPASVTAGAASSVTVTAKDTYGNTTPAYRGTVKLTSTDPAAVLPANYTFTASDPGAHTFSSVTLKTAGSRSVTATDTGNSSITGVASVSVSSAAAASMTLAGIASPATSGASASAAVTTKDAYGNIATGYLGTVQFSSSDSAATLPGAYLFTASDAGTHTFTGVVLRTAGNQSVTAGDGTLSATQSPITVQPGALDHLVLSPQTATITAGGARSFTAQGRDASNNSLGDVTSGTSFSVSPDGTCTTNSCAATAAGTHTITGTKGSATGSATMQVIPAAAVVTVTLSPSALTADGTSTSTVHVHVADQYGNARTGDTVTVATDGDAGLSAVQDGGNGDYTATLTASTTDGTQSITATDGTAAGSATLTLLPGPASHLTLTLAPTAVDADGSTTAQATITVTDAHGNARAGDPVTLTTDGDVQVSAVTDQGFGTYTATVTASTTSGVETLTATDGNASASAQLTERAPVTVTGINPGTRGQGANGGAWGQSVTVTGTGFTPGSLTDFGPGVTVKFTTYLDAGHLTAHVVVATDAAVGSRTATVTVADGRTASYANGFTVSAGPVVSAVTPNQIGPGAQKSVTVTGANFASSVKVTIPGTGVAVTSVSVLDSGHLTVGLSTAFAASPGPRDLSVTNLTDAGSTSVPAALSVTPAPVVAEISPSALGGGAVANVTVSGANFVDGAKLSIAGTGVAVLTASWVDEGHLSATLSIAGSAVPGARTVSVINPDGGRGSSSGGFAVNAAPTVASITPASLARGSSSQVTITGTNFVPGASVSLSTGVTMANVVVLDATTITATASVSASTGTGSRTLTVTNPDLGKASLLGAVQVVNAAS